MQPNKINEEVRKDAGFKLIDEILERDSFRMPTHIIAITGFAEIEEKLSKIMAERLIPFLYCDMASDGWIGQLQLCVQRVLTAKRGSVNSDSYESYLCIVCALDTPELRAVLRNGWKWETIKRPNDATIYYRAIVEQDGHLLECNAAAAPRKGMPAAAVIATKMIALFRPKYIAMVGITAGYAARTKFGDVIAADSVWDWGSGKLVSYDGRKVFQPEPHQLNLNVDIKGQLKLMLNDAMALSTIRSEWMSDKPDSELSVRIGPVVSGAAVLADKDASERLLLQHRGLLGVDMETYAVFCAAEEAPTPRPIVFSLKSVVDFADENKDDRYQSYAAYTSARILKLFVEEYLKS